MITQELIDFIKQHMAAGTSKEEVSKMLSSAGWLAADIDDAFRVAAPATMAQPSTYTPPITSTVTQPVTSMPSIQPQSMVQPVTQPIAQQVYQPMQVQPLQPAAEPVVTIRRRSKAVPFLITAAIIVLLGVAGYFGYGYYQKQMAPQPAQVVGEAFANLLEAQSVTFNGTEGLVSVMGTSSSNGDYSISTGGMEARSVGGTFYSKEGSGEDGMMEWFVAGPDGKPSDGLVFLNAEQRAPLAAALRTGNLLNIDQEFPQEGSMGHYAVSVNSQAGIQTGLEGVTMQTWIDIPTRTVIRVSGEGMQGAMFDLSFTDIGRTVMLQAPDMSGSTGSTIMPETAPIVTPTSAATVVTATTAATVADPARVRADAASVRSILASMAAQAELYSMNEGSGTYGTINTTAGSCLGVGAGSMFTSTKGLKDLVAKLVATSGAYRCQSISTAWAASAKLADATYFCVDSTGYTGSVAAVSAAEDAKCK